VYRLVHCEGTGSAAKTMTFIILVPVPVYHVGVETSVQTIWFYIRFHAHFCFVIKNRDVHGYQYLISLTLRETPKTCVISDHIGS
jgi:hypothetical protein